VLVQLPVCNEGDLALRVAAAACALDARRRADCSSGRSPTS